VTPDIALRIISFAFVAVGMFIVSWRPKTGITLALLGIAMTCVVVHHDWDKWIS
jgi:hypothetical protein